MPVGRIVLKEISESKKLSLLKTDGARLLYTWLIPHLNVNGCFSADPIVVRARIFTRLEKTIEVINSYLDDLEENELIIRYNSEGDDFLIMPNFAEKQPKLNKDREGKVNIPLPTQDQLTSKSRSTPTQYKLNQVKLNKANATLDQPQPVDNSPQEESPSPEKDLLFIEIKNLYFKIQELYPAFKIQKFFQTYKNKNPKAITHTFNRLIEQTEKIGKVEAPWAYCEKIITLENMNYNASDHEEQSKEFKKPIDLVNWAQNFKTMQV